MHKKARRLENSARDDNDENISPKKDSEFYYLYKGLNKLSKVHYLILL